MTGIANEADIANEVLINGRPEKVFDVVTIARYWPEWLVVTRAAAGVTETPFQIGDHIYEFVRTPSGSYEFNWTILELDRPRGMKMQAQDGTVIAYTFAARPEGTLFRRMVKLGPEFGERKAVTNDTEQRSVENLKALVEDILWREQKGPYSEQ